jgi:hypothetical protein
MMETLSVAMGAARHAKPSLAFNVATQAPMSAPNCVATASATYRSSAMMETQQMAMAAQQAAAGKLVICVHPQQEVVQIAVHSARAVAMVPKQQAKSVMMATATLPMGAIVSAGLRTHGPARQIPRVNASLVVTVSKNQLKDVMMETHRMVMGAARIAKLRICGRVLVAMRQTAIRVLAVVTL